ncbi:MAG: hypothetical protein U0936_07215 [Planctomycetaceae bacterium]
MTNNVPIAIFAFRRLDLLKKTLTALQRSDGYPGGPVFVFSDAARSDVEGEGEQVADLRSWLAKWCLEQNAHLIQAKVNLGLRRSIVDGVTQLLQDYDRIIVIEDDIVVSRSFLKFMHQSLEAFHANERVFQISGYMVPHRGQLTDSGFLSVPGCWGWATWRRAWDYYNDDAVVLRQRLERLDLHRFDIDGTYGYWESLKLNAEGKQNTWMVRWYASMFLESALVGYPGRSLTRNIGFAEPGTNCGPGTMGQVFESQAISDALPLWPSPDHEVIESAAFRSVLSEFYRWQQHRWSAPSFRQVWAGRFKRVLKYIRLRSI